MPVLGSVVSCWYFVLLLLLPRTLYSSALLIGHHLYPPSSVARDQQHLYLIRQSFHRKYGYTQGLAVSSVSVASSQVVVDPPPLTIIIPAYNEEKRVERTILAYAKYLSRSYRWADRNKVSIVVVNDGSTDETVNVLTGLIQSQTNTVLFPISLISLPYNQGKGAALAAAINVIDDTYCNSLILTTDADGSADIACLDRLYDVMVSTLKQKSIQPNRKVTWTEPVIVCGYRTYGDTATGRLFFRWGFRTVVQCFCGRLGTRDSQCGFKLMTVNAAKQLYRNLHLNRWSHDVEVLYRAKLLNLMVTEAPVRWQDMDGSKLKAEGIVNVASRMFFDVIQCRLFYGLGLWKIDEP